jgi:hypothetical protein
MPRHESVRVTGTVEDVFGHRFVLSTEYGKILADLTPKGQMQCVLRSGEEITIEGERRPSEVKIRKITLGGKTVEIGRGEDPHGHRHHEPGRHRHDPTAAIAAVRKQGYEVIGDPRVKPKHFEILARKGDGLRELHVELDGHIRKAKPIELDDRKWTPVQGH